MDLLLREYGADVDRLITNLWVSQDHVKDLHSGGHIIGLHSHSHPTVLAKMPREEQEKEYVQNFEVIQSVTGQTPETMSHPCNSYNSDTLDILKNLGVKLGFRANMETHRHSRYEYPRQDHSGIIRDAGL